MDKKKVTRRVALVTAVALGTAIGGLAASPFILRALGARYDVAIPSGTGTVKVTREYRGRDITVDVPLKRPSSPEEKKEMEAQIMAQLKKDPTYIEVETQERLKFRDENRKETIDFYAELEKQALGEIAKSPYSEEKKEAAARAIKEKMQAERAKSLAHVDKLAQDYIDSLSKH